MNAIAVVLEEPERLCSGHFIACTCAPTDVVVDIDWSGISTAPSGCCGAGACRPFPGSDIRSFPGYESVGHIRKRGSNQLHRIGEPVSFPALRASAPFAPLCGAASRVVVPSQRASRSRTGSANAERCSHSQQPLYHAVISPDGAHAGLDRGTWCSLGRLVARVCLALGAHAPTVWETNPVRMSGADGYRVVAPQDDARRDYRAIVDVPVTRKILDTLVQRLAPQGEIVLAGFYRRGSLLRVSSGLYARSPHSHCRGVEGDDLPCHARTDRDGPALARRPHHAQSRRA